MKYVKSKYKTDLSDALLIVESTIMQIAEKSHYKRKSSKRVTCNKINFFTCKIITKRHINNTVIPTPFFSIRIHIMK